MISLSAMAAYYWLLGGPMWVNGRVYRAFHTPSTGIVKACMCSSLHQRMSAEFDRRVMRK